MLRIISFDTDIQEEEKKAVTDLIDFADKSAIGGDSKISDAIITAQNGDTWLCKEGPDGTMKCKKILV